MTALLEPLVSCYHITEALPWSEIFHRKAILEVEIGFGLGEWLLRRAISYPERDFVGLEENWERVYRALKKIHECRKAALLSADNIRIFEMDARVALERLFRPESIDSLHCLFPCPWPKKSHWKNRLLNRSFLELVNSRLILGGQLNIVTDHEGYFQWIQQHIPQEGFRFLTRKIGPRYDTKFERKWLAAGQKEFFEITLIKGSHLSVAVKEALALQSYRLDSFNPRSFKLDNYIDEISVIFKDILYDPEREEALVLVLVQEGHLTQHFSVSIIKRENFWRVCKANGQNFIPTPGLAKAIEVVFEAAKKSEVVK